MWHIHPQQQQRGIQLAPARPATLQKEAHAAGEKGRTLCDMTGARQQGFARPRPEPCAGSPARQEPAARPGA